MRRPIDAIRDDLEHRLKKKDEREEHIGDGEHLDEQSGLVEPRRVERKQRGRDDDARHHEHRHQRQLDEVTRRPSHRIERREAAERHVILLINRRIGPIDSAPTLIHRHVGLVRTLLGVLVPHGCIIGRVRALEAAVEGVGPPIVVSILRKEVEQHGDEQVEQNVRADTRDRQVIDGGRRASHVDAVEHRRIPAASADHEDGEERGCKRVEIVARQGQQRRRAVAMHFGECTAEELHAEQREDGIDEEREDDDVRHLRDRVDERADDLVQPVPGAHDAKHACHAQYPQDPQERQLRARAGEERREHHLGS